MARLIEQQPRQGLRRSEGEGYLLRILYVVVAFRNALQGYIQRMTDTQTCTAFCHFCRRRRVKIRVVAGRVEGHIQPAKVDG